MNKTLAMSAAAMLCAVFAWSEPAPAKEAAPQAAKPKVKVVDCLAAHESELSKSCAEAVDEVQERTAKREERLNKLCGPELQSLCKDPASAAEPMKCLQSHAADLKGRCAKMVQRSLERQSKPKDPDAAKKPNKVREACKDDIAKLCRPAKKGKKGNTAPAEAQPK